MKDNGILMNELLHTVLQFEYMIMIFLRKRKMFMERKRIL